MPSASPNKAKRIAAGLRIAKRDRDDAEILSKAGSGNRAYLISQAVEKLLRAALMSEDIQMSIKEAHFIDENAKKLPEGHPLKTHFAKLGYLRDYATTYRYGTDAGRIPQDMSDVRFGEALSITDEIISQMSTHFGVGDLSISATSPPATVTVMRTAKQSSDEEEAVPTPSTKTT